MKLWLADYHLEAGRLCLAQVTGSPTEESKKQQSRTPTKDVRVDAKEHIRAARELIRTSGYHRRDKELGELEGI